MDKKAPNEETQGHQFVLTDLASVIFTNQVTILSANQEEVEIGICLKNPDNKSSKVTHRLISTTPHFHRIADMFKSFSDQIKQNEQLEEK